MSMGKYRRGKRTARYKKKRYMKRKIRSMKKYSKPDGQHNAKIVQRLALTVNNNGSLNNTANYTVAWQLPEADL